MATEIEKFVVAVESDISELVEGTEKGVKKAEGPLNRLEKSGKKAFNGLKMAVAGVTVALTAMTVALVAAFQAAERGIQSVRIRQGFKNLANSIGQSSDAILASMTKASGGTIKQMELMRQANVAMQLGVARTPEEFAKLTRSAIVLGRAVGRGPVQALDDLINAAGRRSTEVLDNLGISLADVNEQMERMSQEQFGAASSTLDQAAKNALFMKAALEVADRSAQALGGSVEDVGSSMEQARANFENFQADFNEGMLIVVDSVIRGWGIIGEQLFGSGGIFPLAEEAAISIQEIFAKGLATVAAIGNTAIQGLTSFLQIVKGERAITDLLPGNVAASAVSTFTEKFDTAFGNIQNRFSDILGGDKPGEGAGKITPLIDEGQLEEGSERSREILNQLAGEFLDIQEETNKALEEEEKEHQARMVSITEKAAQNRARAEERASDALIELSRETAKRRAEIFADTKTALSDLEADTDQTLEDERDSFQKDELRATEDHLRAMRRARESFVVDLEEAVANRDARAVVNIQRRFRLQQAQASEEFRTRKRRDREDNQERLREISENESRRSQEILRAQDEQLRGLKEAEGQRRKEIEGSLARQLASIEEARIKAEEEEEAASAARQETLSKGLEDRLKMVARELADEDGINRRGAEKILRTLNEFFGINGKVDQIMESFNARRKAKMTIEIGFDGSDNILTAPGGTPIPSFAQGGSLIARQPTLALFGEAGPEAVHFTPLDATGGGAKKFQIEFSGSAPPGIGAMDRDAIAGVVVRAIRESGFR